MIGCPFVLLISQDGKGPGFTVKTLKTNHNCQDAFKNSRSCTTTLAKYFKSKVQNTPQYKFKRQDLKDQFNLTVCSSKLKRAKRMTLQKVQEIFLGDYNQIEAYANEHRLSNLGNDIVINLSKDGLKQEDQGATLMKKRGRIEDEYVKEVEEEEEAHEEVDDANSLVPQLTQEEEYHFRPTPNNSITIWYC
ncbi:hypothetical protein RDI58_022712 [Solanum bulbocastanum]|uniref:Uncharacterized protein n=1 Tax=Solanum bulbocastanum TaxID=147425 RepID=A0AAN8T2L3_SOLBU